MKGVSNIAVSRMLLLGFPDDVSTGRMGCQAVHQVCLKLSCLLNQKVLLTDQELSSRGKGILSRLMVTGKTIGYSKCLFHFPMRGEGSSDF